MKYCAKGLELGIFTVLFTGTWRIMKYEGIFYRRVIAMHTIISAVQGMRRCDLHDYDGDKHPEECTSLSHMLRPPA